MTVVSDRAPGLVGSVAALVALGTVAYPLRMYVRTSNRALGWDDWCMTVAVVSATISVLRYRC
jgi:hypothetical protein